MPQARLRPRAAGSALEGPEQSPCCVFVCPRLPPRRGSCTSGCDLREAEGFSRRQSGAAFRLLLWASAPAPRWSALGPQGWERAAGQTFPARAAWRGPGARPFSGAPAVPRALVAASLGRAGEGPSDHSPCYAGVEEGDPGVSVPGAGGDRVVSATNRWQAVTSFCSILLVGLSYGELVAVTAPISCWGPKRLLELSLQCQWVSPPHLFFQWVVESPPPLYQPRRAPQTQPQTGC